MSGFADSPGINGRYSELSAAKLACRKSTDSGCSDMCTGSADATCIGDAGPK